MNLLDIFKKNKGKVEYSIRKTSLDDLTEPFNVPKYPSKGGRPKTITDAHIIQIMRWKEKMLSNSEIARRLHVSETTIRRCIKSYKRTESVTATPEARSEETI